MLSQKKVLKNSWSPFCQLTRGWNSPQGDHEPGKEPGDIVIQLEEKEQTLAEVKNKFSRNRQILTSNWEQAETEVILIYFSFGPYCG